MYVSKFVRILGSLKFNEKGTRERSLTIIKRKERR